jgi:protein-disulfide isomerase
MTDQSDDRKVLNDDVMVFKRSYVYAILLPLTFLLGLATGYVLWGRETSSPAVEPTAVVEEAPQRYDVSVDDDPYLGPEDAPVVIIEFSDFNCGFCGKWYLENLEALFSRYPEEVRFVYRDYPLLSESSVTASQAAQCAHEQDAFWDFHDALFTRDEPKNLETYLLLAEEFSLDIQNFEECYQSDRTMEEIENDARFAAGLGIRGTPTFFINGIPLVGAQPLETFTAIIEDELSN